MIFQYKNVLENALYRKELDSDELSNRIDRFNSEIEGYVRNLNWSLMTKNAKFKLTKAAIQDICENYHKVCYEYLVFELNKYYADEKENKFLAHKILRYKVMCDKHSDVNELRNLIAHSCEVKQDRKQFTFISDKGQSKLTYAEKEFYLLPFFIAEKTRSVFLMISLIHLDTGIRLLQNYNPLFSTVDGCDLQN